MNRFPLFAYTWEMSSERVLEDSGMAAVSERSPRFRLFLPLYLLFLLSILLPSLLAGFLETYALMPFEHFAGVLKDNADRIAPLVDYAVREHLDGESFPETEKHQWFRDEVERNFSRSLREILEERAPFFRLRHSHWLWIPVMAVWMLPVYRHQFRYKKGRTGPDPSRRVVRRILNLPVFLLLLPVIGGVWKLCVEITFVNSNEDLFSGDPKGVYTASFLLFIAVAGYFNLWFTTKYVNNHLARHIFVGPSLYDLKKARAPGMTMRIFLMIISIGFIPIILNIYLPVSFNIRWYSGMISNGELDFVVLAATFTSLLVTSVLNIAFLLIQIAGIVVFRNNIQVPVNGLIGSMKAVARGDFTTRSTVLAADEIGQLKGHFNSMVEGLEEREKIRDTFGKYVSQDVARKLLDDPEQTMAGIDIISTVMFTDIRNFTAFSEGRSPREVIEFLNEYFSFIVAPVVVHQGVVNKFIGDSVMAVFSPVFGLEDHATAALNAALDMRKALEDFNAQGHYETIRHGVGIHTGPLVAGNVGAEDRKEYTVIGDTVNVASRIQSQTKIEGVDILVSGAVREALIAEGADYTLKPHKAVVIRGKSEPYVLYSPPWKE
jgi:adenylate cyclase